MAAGIAGCGGAGGDGGVSGDPGGPVRGTHEQAGVTVAGCRTLPGAHRAAGAAMLLAAEDSSVVGTVTYLPGGAGGST